MVINKEDDPLLRKKWLKKAVKIAIFSVFVVVFFFNQAFGVKKIVEGYPSIITTNTDDGIESSDFSSSDEKNMFMGYQASTIYPKTRIILVTAYSSTPDQTDEDPFITASGKTVKEGVIASNFLPFGTKVRFPEIFEDKIFVVEDKMNKRFNDSRVDIWFPERELAEEFGIRETIIEIIE